MSARFWSNKKGGSPCKETGVTLIELIVVLFVIGVLTSAIVRPNIKGYLEKAELRAAKDTLNLSLNQTRDRALETNLIYKAIFHLGYGKISIYSQHPTQNIWVLESEKGFNSENVKILDTEFNDDQVVYSPIAEPFEDPQTDLPLASLDDAVASTKSITLQYLDKGTDALSVVPLTGAVIE